MRQYEIPGLDIYIPYGETFLTERNKYYGHFIPGLNACFWRAGGFYLKISTPGNTFICVGTFYKSLSEQDKEFVRPFLEILLRLPTSIY